MAQPFSRTLRSLTLDDDRGSARWLAGSLALTLAWSSWFVGARVSEYVPSEQARIEVCGAAHAMDAPVAGRVVASQLVVGAEVQVGDIIVALDATSERLQLAEERARFRAFAPELEALQRRLEAEESALASERNSYDSVLGEARVRQAQAEVRASFANEEAQRVTLLAADGLATGAERSRWQAEAHERRAATEALVLSVARQVGERHARESKARAAIEELRREIAALEGRREVSAAHIESLGHEIERRSVRAPISGRLGERANLAAGTYVQAGQTLGVIVPPGRYHAVASFPARTALGKIRPGQSARLRLSSFPSPEFGVLDAQVSRVASEAHNGAIRAELSLVEDPRSRIALEHGLMGSAEVEVSDLSPAALVLRAIGAWFEQTPEDGAQPAQPR